MCNQKILHVNFSTLPLLCQEKPAKIRIHSHLTDRISPIHKKNPAPFAMLCPWQGYAENQVHPQTRMPSSTGWAVSRSAGSTVLSILLNSQFEMRSWRA